MTILLAGARGKPKSLMGLESMGGVRRRDLKGLLRDRLPTGPSAGGW